MDMFQAGFIVAGIIAFVAIILTLFAILCNNLFPIQCQKCESKDLIDCDEGVECTACGEVKKISVRYPLLPFGW